MFSWQCFRARSVDDGAAIPSGSSAALFSSFYVLCCLLHVLMDQVDVFLIAQSMKVASWKSFNRAFFPGSSHQLFFLKYSIIRNHE